MRAVTSPLLHLLRLFHLYIIAPHTLYSHLSSCIYALAAHFLLRGFHLITSFDRILSLTFLFEFVQQS